MKKKKYTICFDTVCDGYTPVMETVVVRGKQIERPVTFATRKAAQAEIDSDPEFYNAEDFVCTMDEIGHKAIYTGEEKP